MKFEIKARGSNEIKFSCELGVEVHAERRVLEALKLARASGSDLRDCDLSGSNLSGSNLRGSDLRGSDLRGSDLRGSDLSDSDLTPVRDDIWAVLAGSAAEVPGLRKAIAEGRVDGRTYTGVCACLIGTLANLAHCSAHHLPLISTNASRPAERFFMCILEGDTPETNQFSRLALEWVDQWLDNESRTPGQPELSA